MHETPISASSEHLLGLCENPRGLAGCQEQLDRPCCKPRTHEELAEKTHLTEEVPLGPRHVVELFVEQVAECSMSRHTELQEFAPI